MKRILYFALLIASFMSFAACEPEVQPDSPETEKPQEPSQPSDPQEPSEPQAPEYYTQFVANVDVPQTQPAQISRTVMSGLKSYWDGEESIWILDPRNDDMGWKKEYVCSAEMSQSATFVQSDETTSLSGNPILAMYPSQPASGALWSGNVEDAVTGLWLGNEQNAVKGSYDPSAHIAVAYSSDDKLYFKNVVTLMKFHVLSSDDFNEVRFFTYDDTKIAGNFKLTYNNDDPIAVSDGNYLTSDVKIKGNIEAGSEYYFAILPTLLDGGFGVEINGYKVKEITAEQAATEFAEAVDFKRNTVVDLESLELNFGICGDVTGWADGADIMLQYNSETKRYEVDDVTFEGQPKFKLRVNGSWITELGCGGKLLSDAANDLILGGGDCQVEDGTYDISFDAANKKLYMTLLSAPTPVKDVWRMAGDINGWNTGDDNYLMVEEGDWLVFRNLVIEGGEKKILFVKNGTWTKKGGSWAGKDAQMDLVDEGGDIVVPEGTYDVYINSTMTKAYFVTPGASPVVIKDKWRMAGEINGWNTGDDNYLMVEEGGWLVFRNLVIEGGEKKILFVKNGTWTKKGGSWAGKDVQMNLVDNGGDIVVPEGTYDVYINPAMTDAWFMTPGQTPMN